MKVIKLLAVIFILSLVVSSCEKELELLDDNKNTTTVFQPHDNAIEKAKSMFYETEGSAALTELNGCEEVAPMWDYGRELNSNTNNPILIVPIEIPLEAYESGIGAQLVFYNDDSCETPFELVVYNASDGLKTNKTAINNHSFSGAVYVIDVCNQTTKMYGLDEGKVFKVEDHIIEEGFFCEEDTGSRNFIKWLFGYRVKCPKLKDSWWSSVWRDAGSWFKNAWLWWLDLANGGNGTYVYVPNGNRGFPSYGGDTDNGDNGGSASGGGNQSLAQLILEGNYFGGDVSFAIKLFDRYREENDLFGCKEEILALYLECLASNDIIDIPTLKGSDGIGTRGFGDEDGGGTFHIGGMIDDLFNAADSECLAQLKAEYGQSTYDVQVGEHEDAICFVISNNGFDVSDAALYGYIKNSCIDLHEACINEKLNASELQIMEAIINNNNWPGPFLFNFIMEYLKIKWKKRNTPTNQLNDCEIELATNNVDCASYLGLNWITANLLTISQMGGNSGNDCSDAFRHTFYNAMNAAFCGVDMAREFGQAHECVTDSETASTMDLHNNEVGYAIINNYPDITNLLQGDNFISNQQGMQLLVESICESITNGSMLVFLDPEDNDPDNNPDNYLINSNNCSCVN